MTKRSVIGKLAVSVVAAATTYVFMINLCNLVFQCGCRSMWAGMADHCNIHTPGARHCPWCSHGQIGYSTVLALVLIPQFLVSWLPGPWGWRTRLGTALFLFPVVGSLIGLVMGWWEGYW